MRISDWSSDVCSSDLHGFDLTRIARFYAGGEPASYAEGEAFQSTDPLAFHGSNGMTASLLGLHRALAEDDASAIELALRRHLLLYAIPLSAARIPLHFIGADYSLGTHPPERKCGKPHGQRPLH